MCKNGFLLPIDLLIKVHPSITGDIKLVGLIQKKADEEDITIPNLNNHVMSDDRLPSTIENHELLILTDSKGNISNISPGMMQALGLHPRFFNYNADNFLSMINIDALAVQTFEGAIQDSLQSEGVIITYDTTDILMKIDAELITHEELENAKPYMKKCEALTTMRVIPLVNGINACLYNLKLREMTDDPASLDVERFKFMRNNSKAIRISANK